MSHPVSFCGGYLVLGVASFAAVLSEVHGEAGRSFLLLERMSRSPAAGQRSAPADETLLSTLTLSLLPDDFISSMWHVAPV